jgi:hypothetical protein
LKDHADPPADLGRRNLQAVELGAVIAQPAADAGAWGDVVHAVEAAQHRGLSATRGADEGGDLVLVDLHRDPADRTEGAVEDLDAIEIEHDGTVWPAGERHRPTHLD